MGGQSNGWLVKQLSAARVSRRVLNGFSSHNALSVFILALGFA